jgi:photosystem II stability/assembly factor-like uncharacterized protein
MSWFRRVLGLALLVPIGVFLFLPLASAPGQSDVKPAAAAADRPLDPDWVKALTWRCIGPASMGGRITAISVFEADSSTYWIATASGGLLKTVNNGTTFEHQFDHEATVSVGSVCVAPSDRNIVWVGTGENNPRNSVSYGDGVYKSTDGGKHWQNMGLRQSFQVGKILVNPKDPNVVYVGALGRLYGPGEERGLYKTADGGKTWQRVLFVDDKTGVIDMRMSPADPDTLIVATWERQRDEFDGFFGPVDGDSYGPIKVHAPGSGLYKTTDGGKTFKKLQSGLPTAKLGRVGLDWYAKDPRVVYAIIDSEKVGTGSTVYAGLQAEDAPGGARLTAVTAEGPAAKAGLKVGDVVNTVEGKEVKGFEDLVNAVLDHKAGDAIKLAVKRGDEKKDISVTLGTRPAAGGAGAASTLSAGFRAENEEDGLRVTRVISEEATKAGLKEGDLVTAVEGKPVEGYLQAMIALARTHKAGDKIKVTVQRGGQKKDIELVLAAGGGGRGGAGGGRGAGGGGGGRGGAANRPFGSGLGGQRENVQFEQGRDGFQTGGIFKSTDAGETWVRINSLNPRPMYFSQVRVDPSDEKYLYVLGVSIYRSNDGGKTFSVARGEGGRGVHADQHALWIDPKDGRHMLVGCDGGYYVTYDRMANWDHLNQMAIGQFYHVDVDSRRNYHVYGGLQDNGSWGGPSMVRGGAGPVNEDWISVGGGDGFVCRVDRNDPDVIYTESQGGNIRRMNIRTGESGAVRPGGPAGGGRGGGGGGAGAAGGQRHRFNWNTPFILSSHNSHILYVAGEYVFRSVDRGNDLQIISPEITATKKGSGTALGESPRNANVLWAGTDDGALWVTRDGGKEWKNVAKNVGLPGPFWVASIEPSRTVEGRAYVAFDAHRSDDDKPYVYVTEDYGQTWKSLRGNLPIGSSRVLREDIHNPELLYLGTEFAAWASLDRGRSWHKINNNLPTVAVHEFAQHPTAGEIVAATHGRSLWILDVSALRQMTPEAVSASAFLYKPTTAVRWQREPRHAGTNRRFVGQNPPDGAMLYYSLAKKADKVTLKVVDIDGKTVRELTAPAEAGLHRVNWNLTRGTAVAGAGGGGRGGRGGAGGGVVPAAPPAGEQTEQPEAPPAGGGRGGFGFGGRPVSPGTYRVVLTVDGKELTQALRVEADPDAPASLLAEEGKEVEKEPGDEDEEEEEERMEREAGAVIRD